MIRFIIRKEYGGFDFKEKLDYLTLDIDVPELEKQLRAGGHDQYAYEQYTLQGVEILTKDNKQREK